MPEELKSDENSIQLNQQSSTSSHDQQQDPIPNEEQQQHLPRQRQQPSLAANKTRNPHFLPLSLMTLSHNEKNKNNNQHPTIWRSIWNGIQTFQHFCGTVVNHSKVQLFIIVLIAINAIMLGVATFNFVIENPEIENGFEIFDQVCLVIFTIELAFHFGHLGFKLFLDGWLVFDFLIILTSWALPSLQIVRAFRIFRALRLITRIKMMKNLVVAVFSVIPRMSAIGLLLLLIFYIFAVMMTQMFGDLYLEGKTEQDYFGTLGMSLFTLFQIMTLDDWAGISKQVIDDYFWAWVPFLIFVVVSGFVVVNLIIAVICDAVATLDDNAKSKIHGSFDESESQTTMEPTLKEQLEMLQDMVDELSRSQEEILQVLSRLKLRSKGDLIDNE